jgi:hypothetical protein
MGNKQSYYLTGQVDNRVFSSKPFKFGEKIVGLRHPYLSFESPKENIPVKLPIKYENPIIQWISCSRDEYRECKIIDYMKLRKDGNAIQATFIGYLNLFGNFVPIQLYRAIIVPEKQPYALSYPLK